LTIVWLKSLHIAALVIWCGGLLTLPILLTQREAAGNRGAEVDRLHRYTRFAYIALVSPAAFVAIGSGTALILVREIFTVWLAIKLVFVGFLVFLHVWLGLLVLSVFKEDKNFRPWRAVSGVVTISLTLTGILWAVLAKPDLSTDFLPADFHEPGGLRRLAAAFIPGLRP
jgi:putative membrane protein